MIWNSFDGIFSLIHFKKGINTKVAQVVAKTLNISLDLIAVQEINTIISPNSNLTGGSITSESVCLCAIKVCNILLERLKPIRDSLPKATWPELVQAAYMKSIELSAKSEINSVTDAKPYNIMGFACAEIEVDVLTGQYQILRVDISEDTGLSLNPAVDVGQVEGRILSLLFDYTFCFYLSIFLIFFRCFYYGCWILVN